MRDRAPFVWTPEQPVRHDAIIAGVTGQAAPDDGRNAPNRWFMLRRTFTLSRPTRGRAHVTCDGRYKLWLNGEAVGRGPARCTPTFQRYDTHDVTDLLRDGENTLAVLVHTYGVDTSWYEVSRELWHDAFGDGGLWLVMDAEGANGPAAVTTDTDWRVQRSKAWTQDVPTGNHGLGFVEVLDGRALPDGWTEPGFDDADWPQAIEQVSGGGGPDSFFGGLTIRPFPVLLPNPLPAQTGALAVPMRVLWQRHAEPRPDLPVWEQTYAEALGAATAFDTGPLTRGEAITLRTPPGEAAAILLDMGRVVTGHVTVVLEGQGGETIDLTVAEGIAGEWEDGFDPSEARVTPAPTLGADTHLARYTARAGLQTFERFDWQAVRYLQVTVRDAPDGVVLSRLGVETRNYPVEHRGAFACDDDLLNRLWTTGRYTLHQCMHDAFEDCPSREQRQWSGDATVETLVGHAAFGQDTAPLTAEYLRKTAESQRPDGLTQMFAPGNHGHTRLMIPDWTLQWILCAGEHHLWTGDDETIAEVWPSIVKALAWFRRVRAERPLVANMPNWHFFDWAALGRSGYACALNAQLAGTLDVAASLGRAVGDAGMADRLAAEADGFRAALEGHWDEARGVYVDVVDPVTGERQPRTSQHANAAMILWGGAPEDRWARIIDRVTDQDRLRFTAAPPIKNEGEAMDEDHDVVLANTFYSHFVYEALAKAGRLDLVLAQARQRYGPMLRKGATTLWESYEPTASLCHGFSASPTYQMSTKVLGVCPVSPGGAQVRFAPNLCDLTEAEGTVPLAAGPAKVRLRRSGDAISAELSLPAAVTATVTAPPGRKLTDGPKAASGKTAFRFEPI